VYPHSLLPILLAIPGFENIAAFEHTAKIYGLNIDGSSHLSIPSQYPISVSHLIISYVEFRWRWELRTACILNLSTARASKFLHLCNLNLVRYVQS
jgi:hypothetical protein